MAPEPPIELITSLEDAANAVRNNAKPVANVRFHLAPETSLGAAALLKTRATPGLTGFQLVNPELMNCKNRTKIEFEVAYKRVYRQSMRELDGQLRDLDAPIAELKRLIGLPLEQIPDQGPPITQRNRGLQEVIYLHPPSDDFYRYDEFNNAGPDVPYRPAIPQNEREAARALDHRAQRAWWSANLRILETKKRIVEQSKIELERSLKIEFDSALESPSDLGAGYVDYTFRH